MSLHQNTASLVKSLALRKKFNQLNYTVYLMVIISWHNFRTVKSSKTRTLMSMGLLYCTDFAYQILG